MQLFVYDEVGFSEYVDFELNDLNRLVDFSKIIGLTFHGLSNVDLIKAIGTPFSIDTYVLSDVLNTSRRTKLEESHDRLFLISNRFCQQNIRITSV